MTKVEVTEDQKELAFKLVRQWRGRSHVTEFVMTVDYIRTAREFEAVAATIEWQQARIAELEASSAVNLMLTRQAISPTISVSALDLTRILEENARLQRRERELVEAGTKLQNELRESADRKLLHAVGKLLREHGWSG